LKAIVAKKHGDLSDVVVTDVPVPEIGPDEVLVQLKAAALNRLDFWVLEGWRGLNLKFPHILGCDGSGIIDKLGANVAGFKVGDRVAINPTYSCGKCSYCIAGKDQMCDQFAIFGEHIPGFYAEYQAVPVRNLLAMPDEVSFETAAAASLVYVTAWHSLITTGRLIAGESVLIVGATGGVNTACIDISRLAGAGKIFVVGSSEPKLALARQLGADYTVDRSQENWGAAIFRATGKKGVDIVVDNVGAETYSTSLRSLKRGGRLLTVGNTSGAHVEFDNRYIFGKHLSILGTTMGPIKAYNEVMELVFSSRLKPVIDSVYPLDDGINALKRLDLGDTAGKLVLRI